MGSFPLLMKRYVEKGPHPNAFGRRPPFPGRGTFHFIFSWLLFPPISLLGRSHPPSMSNRESAQSEDPQFLSFFSVGPQPLIRSTFPTRFHPPFPLFSPPVYPVTITYVCLTVPVLLGLELISTWLHSSEHDVTLGHPLTPLFLVGLLPPVFFFFPFPLFEIIAHFAFPFDIPSMETRSLCLLCPFRIFFPFSVR